MIDIEVDIFFEKSFGYYYCEPMMHFWFSPFDNEVNMFIFINLKIFLIFLKFSDVVKVW